MSPVNFLHLKYPSWGQEVSENGSLEAMILEILGRMETRKDYVYAYQEKKGKMSVGLKAVTSRHIFLIW